MSYLYKSEITNYEDFSSGRVLYNQQGATAFPVRLANEIFMRCTDILIKNGNQGPYTIYDPLCGGAYTLTTLGILHGSEIGKLSASDIEDKVVELARKNLSLLTEAGLTAREEQLKKMLDEYGKESHREALVSLNNIRNILKHTSHPIETQCFINDIIKPDYGLLNDKVDMVISDLPYGEVVDWVKEESEEQTIEKLLENLLPILKKDSVVALTSRKKTKIKHESYQCADHFVIGKRQTVILKPIKS